MAAAWQATGISSMRAQPYLASGGGVCMKKRRRHGETKCWRAAWHLAWRRSGSGNIIMTASKQQRRHQHHQ